MKRLHSLRTRLVLWTVMLEAILLLVLVAVVLFAIQSLQERQISETLRLGATQLNAVIDVQDDQYTAEVEDVLALRRSGVLTWVLMPDGTPVETVGDAGGLPVPTDLPVAGQFQDATLGDGSVVRLLVAPLQEEGNILGMLILALPLKSNQLFGRFILWSLGLAIPVVLLLSTVGGFFLADRALAPVSTITETARQISAADLSQRLQLDLPDDEIGELARTFDGMLERLDQAFQRERQLTADVSHELRTPLSMLKTQLSLARSLPRDAATLTAMMAEMEGDVDRITHLITSMLELTAVEQAALPLLTPIDLADILAPLSNQLMDAAQQKQIALHCELGRPGTLLCLGDAERLHHVFTNLVENALKYTPKGGTVAIHADRRARGDQHMQQTNKLVVTITDTGMGIAPEHLPHLFERFYRVDTARTRDSGGFGLGLAIAQVIVQRHGGAIEVDSKLNQGTTFIVTLPIGSDCI